MNREPFPALSDLAVRSALRELHEDYDSFSDFLAAPHTKASGDWIGTQTNIAEAKTNELVHAVFHHPLDSIRERARMEVIRRYEAEYADSVREKASEIDLELDSERRAA